MWSELDGLFLVNRDFKVISISHTFIDDAHGSVRDPINYQGLWPILVVPLHHDVVTRITLFRYER